MTGGRVRLRMARWLASSAGEPLVPVEEPRPIPAPAVDRGIAWQGICDRFSLQILGFAEQLRPELDGLESDEQDTDRLQRLYAIDHAVTRMRRSARDLRVLAERNDEELAGHVTSLMDVIRVAESSIEHYTRVEIGTVADLAVVPYAADDIASIVAALLENATMYSPSTVSVSAHLLETGGVMFRIEDSGIGLESHRLEWLNAVLADEVPPIDERTGRRTGFPVIHRLARRHDVGVRLMCRSLANVGQRSGTTAMVNLPAQLVCEIPAQPPAVGRRPRSAAEAGRSAAHGRAGHLTVAARPASAPPAPPAPQRTAPPAAAPIPEPARASAPAPRTAQPDLGALPRRERKSLRGPGPGSGAAPRARPLARLDSDDGADPGAGPTTGRSFADDLNAFTAAGTPAPDGPPPHGRSGGPDDPEGEAPR